MAKKLRRYKLNNLPKVSRQHVQLVNALMWKLPQTAFEAGFKERLKELLEPLVHADVEVWFEGVRALPTGELKQLLGDPCCAAVIGLPPREEKALLEVDLKVAQMCIDKILGGNAEDADVSRPLSEIEDGVFSFVLLKVLGMLQAEASEEGASALRLEGVYGSFNDLKERFPVDAEYVYVGFKLFFDTKVGYARVFMPAALVAETFQPTPPSEGPALERAIARVVERIDVVRPLKAPFGIEVGRIAFTMADLDALEVEDIILVEETEVRIEPQPDDQPPVLTGRVTGRIGQGAHGTLQCVLGISAGGRYQVEIEGISPLGEPAAKTHLFRGSLGSPDGEEEMASENADRPSPPGVTGSAADDAAFADRLRRAAAARLRGEPSPLSGGDAREPDAEHSDDPDDDDEGGDEPQSVSSEAVGLLEDVTVSMAVELGRVTVSAADVVNLRAGQVIELSRAPGEPVDLVVDGKRVGKGELVEIDGELGVRILSLAR